MDMNAEGLRDVIQKVINDDPTINESKHISVAVEKRGIWPFGKETVILMGNVHLDSDRQKAEKAAALHSGQRGVVNNIQIVL
jgi:osmotically-inducible protein OsmY